MRIGVGKGPKGSLKGDAEEALVSKDISLVVAGCSVEAVDE